MSEGAMQACPEDSDLMIAWRKYQASDAFKNTYYWATTETTMRPERAEEHGVDPQANQITDEQRRRYVEGSLWGAFMAGFHAGAVT